MRSRHISQVIRADPEAVYAYAADPDNLPRWAAGFAQGPITHEGDLLVAVSPMGRITFRFAPANPFGVLDHDVTLPSGQVVTNPLRVLPHPDGSEVVFTLRHPEGVDDEEFEGDAEAVAADLRRLRELTEA